MNPLNSADFIFETNPICTGQGIISPIVINPGEGMFSSTAGLDLNENNGAINADNSSIGSYLVTHQTGGTCPDSVSVEVLIEDCSSLGENHLEFVVEPNPFMEEIEIRSDYGGLISIYSALGEVTYTGNKSPGIPLHISTKHYETGIYYVSLSENKKYRVQKLIKF